MASIQSTGPSALRRVKVPKRQCLRSESQARSFSSTSHCSAATARRLDLSRIAPKQQSINSRVKNLKKSEIPNDIGIIPRTFIRPTWGEGPPFFSSKWRQRLFIDWIAAKQNFTDFIALVYMYKFTTDPETGVRLGRPLDLRTRASVAAEHQFNLSQAIIEANKSAIKEIACSGLAQQQSARIDSHRMRDLPKESWGIKRTGTTLHTATLVRWPFQFLFPFKAIKVVSDRQVDLPFGQNASLRQCTVRIKSHQTLIKSDGSPRIEKDLIEYVVIQRRTIDGDVEDWKIWGTVKPSTYEDALEINTPLAAEKDGSAGRLGMWENIKMSFAERMGRSSGSM